MLVIPGRPGKDLCDRPLGVTRRELLRVGGAGMLGLSLGSLLRLQAQPVKAACRAGPAGGKPRA